MQGQAPVRGRICERKLVRAQTPALVQARELVRQEPALPEALRKLAQV